MFHKQNIYYRVGVAFNWTINHQTSSSTFPIIWFWTLAWAQHIITPFLSVKSHTLILHFLNAFTQHNVSYEYFADVYEYVLNKLHYYCLIKKKKKHTHHSYLHPPRACNKIYILYYNMTIIRFWWDGARTNVFHTWTRDDHWIGYYVHAWI